MKTWLYVDNIGRKHWVRLKVIPRPGAPNRLLKVWHRIEGPAHHNGLYSQWYHDGDPIDPPQ